MRRLVHSLPFPSLLPLSGYIRLRRRFSRCRISPGIKKSGPFEPGNAKCIKKRREGGREVGGRVKGGRLTPTDKRHALCNASLCISEQQTGQWAGTDEGVSLVLDWWTSHARTCVSTGSLLRHATFTLRSGFKMY